MKTITATELARNLRQVLDRLAAGGEELEIERNRQSVGRLIPGPARQTAIEAMADLYRTLSPDAAAGWVKQGRRRNAATVAKEMRDPWAS